MIFTPMLREREKESSSECSVVDGLPSGYVRFLLDLDGKSTTRRHGFEMEGTLTTKGCNNESSTRKLIL